MPSLRTSSSLARHALALLGVVLLVLASATARADVAALAARLDALGTLAESEADLGAAARAALSRAGADRTRGDEAAASRAERIADATISLLERRRARSAAEDRRRAAEAERDAMRARVDAARDAAASDAREERRLAPPGAAP